VAAQEHRNYCDLVCEGGGVKGIGLVGAFSVLEEHDFHPQNVAGTSAGAITAALIAAGYTAAELKDVTFGMDFLRFRDTAWEDKLRSTNLGGTPRRSSSRRGTSTATSRSSGAARSITAARRVAEQIQ
jgi:predicted acylesterase/phospholipase RssA